MKAVLLLVSLFLFTEVLYGDDKRPSITGQKQLSVRQGGSITIRLSDLIVRSDDDDDDDDDRDKGDGKGNDGNDEYPQGYYVIVYPGDNYRFSGATVTPHASFTGELTVPIRVSNGKQKSKKFALKISVIAAAANTPPLITGQHPLRVTEGSSITIRFSDLIVTDPDDDYPSGFIIELLGGTNYSFHNNSVTPAAGFSGTLSVRIRVNDGNDDSPVFPLAITVERDDHQGNTKPVITGQTELSTGKNESITIAFSHLRVTDPDNDYPADFSLRLFSGSNYSLSGRTVQPATNFTGTLSVPVQVHDGRAASESFQLRIRVVEKGKVEITGQRPLIIPEDSVIEVQLSDLFVKDPRDVFPGDFEIVLHAGENYNVDNKIVRPATDFYGDLSVPVQVTDGSETSEPFRLVVRVEPVNDPPLIVMDSASLTFRRGEPLALASTAHIVDVDDENLLRAEISISTDHYQKGHDILSFDTGVDMPVGLFDTETGVLVLAGLATIGDYERALQSIHYEFKTLGDTLPSADTKAIVITVRDPANSRAMHERSIIMIENLDLIIPTGFTPNNDNANDTWVISPKEESESYDEAVIRVYTRTGVMVYETTGLESPWDGRVHGDLLPADSYYYTIELNTSFRKTRYKGVVTILR